MISTCAKLSIYESGNYACTERYVTAIPTDLNLQLDTHPFLHTTARHDPLIDGPLDDDDTRSCCVHPLPRIGSGKP